MNWILLTFISSLASALTQVLEKVLLRDKTSDPIAFSFVFQLMVALIFLTYTILTSTFSQPSLNGIWVNVLAMTLLYGLGSIFTFWAYKTAEASEVSVIFSSSALWSVLAAMVLLGEKMQVKGMLGMFLILMSLIIINIRKTSWNIGKGHFFAILGAAMFGIAFANDAFILKRYDNVASYMVIAFAFPSIISLVFKPNAVFDIPYFFKPKVLVRVLLCSFAYSMSAITVFSAIKIGGQASIINMLRQSGVVFTVVLSYVFLKERDNMRNKAIGVALAMAGGLLLV